MNTPTNNDNVVNLHGDRASHVRSEILMKESLARLPRSIQRIRELAQAHFKAAIHNLFDHVDDSLFELADRAVSNLEQNVFFESMREIRIQRRSMEKRFLFHIDLQFAVLVSGDNEELNNGLQQSVELGEEEDDLSLVSKEELEELVAIDSFVGKSEANNKILLARLAAGVNSVLKTQLDESSFLIGPRALADSFSDATSLINIDIKAKLVLFKLFERYVIAELASVLNKVNTALAEEGVVLPNKPAGSRRQAQRPSNQNQSVQSNSVARPSHAPRHNMGESNGLYETLQSLLEHQQQPQGPSNFSSGAHIPNGSEAYGVTEVSYALMTALSQLQQQVQAAPVGQESQPELFSSVHIQSALQTVTENEQVDNRSQDVIKLVDMLFSFILEDENLPDPVKLLLSRLQIPFIKVALSDDDFFKKEGHPARRLLNEMAMASIGLSVDAVNGKRDMLLNKIETTVNKILLEFDNNFEIFTLLLTDFIAFMEKERRRVMLFEKRAIDAEDGKAKAEVARSYVDSNLDQLLKGRSIPDCYNSFIKGPWSNILFLIYMRQGKESKQWAQALRVAKELVWSALDIRSDEHKEKLATLMPRLKSALKSGLNNISFNPVKQTKFLEQFEEHYQLLLLKFNQAKMLAASNPNQSPSSASETLKAAELTDKKVLDDKKSQAPLVEVPILETSITKAAADSAELTQEKGLNVKRDNVKSDNERSDTERSDNASSDNKSSVKESAPVKSEITPVAKKQTVQDEISADSIEAALKEIDTIIDGPSNKPVESVVVPASNQSIGHAKADKSEPAETVKTSEAVPDYVIPEVSKSDVTETVDAQYLNLVENFTVGVWFEKKDADNVSYRCRLAAIIKSTGKYIFVNRAGIKVAEESKGSLGMQLQSGSLRTLDDGMLFDRALESVIKNLRKPQ